MYSKILLSMIQVIDNTTSFIENYITIVNHYAVDILPLVIGVQRA